MAALRQVVSFQKLYKLHRIYYQRHWRCMSNFVDSIYTTDPVDLNEPTFSKILVANRGEIACRVIKTAKRMGIKTVAVYSLADASALHVKLADESICIGPAPTRESYLRVDNILDAVRTTGAEAVHPGYGFLSENHDFVGLLEKEGVTFIGPSAAAITGMGDKLESKKLAKNAKVNTIPGYDGVARDADHCIEISNKIGYPVMIKAAAGGGGKGMRIAHNEKEVREGFSLSTEEAKSSFGDSRMLVEKFVDKPRHIEIQILGDKHGNVIYLNERECSIQRRNQKVLEEAPSTFLDPETRKAMGEQAVSLAKGIQYSSAGTVEFLVDSKKNFYFLEMNTRLQVEHPITECITGVDLVHQMIRVAKGHKLNIKQSDIGIRGWAIESRVYAEDPFKSFGLPSIGRLFKYKEPTHIPNVRCDSGIEEGSEISIYYDPMICKLVTYGATRQEAIETTLKALDSYVIRGVTHNIPLLRDILQEEQFLKGNITTNYLPETYPDGFKGKQLNEYEVLEMAVVASSIYVKDFLRTRNITNIPSNRLVPNPRTEWSLVILFDHHRVNCTIEKLLQSFKVTADGQVFEIVDNFTLADPVITAIINQQKNIVQLINKNSTGAIRLRYKGTAFNMKVYTEVVSNFLQWMPPEPKVDGIKTIISPMPGLVKMVSCDVGDSVGEGQSLCVIEAMKMQNSLTTAISGKIKSVNCKPGDTVNEGDVLIELA